MERNKLSKNFALIGAAGYIAPRHMQAIKDTNNRLVAAFDPFDSVGILDRYFNDVDFFTEFERETGIKIYNVLQLRLHPAIIDLKEEIEYKKVEKKHAIDLTYITSRGKWYFYSWKGQLEKSGGVATNVGIHFFDMLIWIFGAVKCSEVYYADTKKMSGFIELENAKIRWFLSLDKNDLPDQALKEGKPTYRSITIDNKEVEFSGGFTDLHTIVYKDILNGGGYGIEDARPSIELVHQIRQDKPKVMKSNCTHPFLSRK